MPDDPTFDVLEDPEGNVKELGPLNSNTTKIGVIHNDQVPTLGETNPNGQVDLRRAWLDTAKDPATGDDWLYFAWERDNETGSGFIAYEFMQDPAPAACAYLTATQQQLIDTCNPWANRQAGDFIILWDQQGGSRDLYLLEWSGTAPNLVLSAPQLLDDAVSEAEYSADGFRGEAAVNLTATIFGGSTACLSFANTIPSTVTGNSNTADYKDTILQTAPPISNCVSTTVTTPKTGAGASIPAGGLSIGTGVVAVRDSAVVDIQGGTATPAGSVAFSLCKVDAPGLCTSGGTSVGSVNLTGAAYPVTVVSPTAYVTSVGRYCWRAAFSGDSANGIPGSSDSSATECFTVIPVTPALATTAGPAVPLGTAVTDSATLGQTATQPANPVINLTGTGGAPAGGTIQFTLLKADCTTLATGTPLGGNPQSLPVSGNGTYGPVSFTPDSAGTYHWKAVYIPAAGDVNNLGSTHNAGCNVAARAGGGHDCGLVAYHGPALGTERLGDHLGSRRQRQPGRHRVLRALRVERLRGGRRPRHLQHLAARLRDLPADEVDVELADAAAGTDGDRILLVVGELRQHQPRPAGHPGQLPRDVGPDDHQRRHHQQPVITT